MLLTTLACLVAVLVLTESVSTACWAADGR